MPPALTDVVGAKGGSSIEGSNLGSSAHSLAGMSGSSVEGSNHSSSRLENSTKGGSSTAGSNPGISRQEPAEARVRLIGRGVSRPAVEPYSHRPAEQLSAAKSVAWRGRGELCQLPYAVSPGLWLLVDLWSGFGGGCFCGNHVGHACYRIAN